MRKAVLLTFFLLACGATKPGTITPPAVPVAKAAALPTSFTASIDTSLRDEWKKAGLTPAARADDATFLRRVYIDTVGTIPPPEVIEKFLADTSPDKRTKLVETLLSSQAYVEHWTNYWDDVLMGLETKGALVDRSAFRSWLHDRFAEGAAWDRIASELISATGQNSNGGGKVKGPAIQVQPQAMTTAPVPDGEPDLAVASTPVNGAVNWTLRYEQTPQDLGGAAARTFLGVQIQCAQCHDHKTEKWTQDDFRRFSSGFFRQKVEPIERKSMGLKRVQLVDSAQPMPRFTKNAELAPIAKAKARALDGKELEQGKETRKALASWMTAKENPWFAKAFVNRMWGHFLGRGFHDPVDDMRPSNPAAAPALLDAIAADFARDFDIKRLIRTITATEAYQLASGPENKLWAAFHLVPLGPEELLNAIFQATDLEHTATTNGIKDLEALRSNVVKQYAFLFDTDEEADVPDYSGTVSQALAMLNGALVAQGSRALPGSTVASLAPKATADQIDALTLRVLSRKPTPEEKARWTAYVDNAEAPAKGTATATKPTGPLDRLGKKRSTTNPKQAALEDILWAQLNSSEFTFNH